MSKYITRLNIAVVPVNAEKVPVNRASGAEAAPASSSLPMD
jgi:hypothetical protein